MPATLAGDGILVVYKPRGPTSHDVVARVRRASGERRVGHAGTLDPLAEGVLVLALGRATRLLEYLTGAGKRYRATVTLGVETDTYDAEGLVVITAPVVATEADVRAALDSFRGTIEQRPPLHSAVSVGGRRLYEIARAGGSAEVPVRRVTIYEIELLRYAPPLAEFEVACSSGTYVRSLAHDLGRRLGCGAHLSALVRLQVGPFRAEQAHPLASVLARFDAGEGARLLLPADAAAQHLPRLDLSEADAGGVRHGLAVGHGQEAEGGRQTAEGGAGGSLLPSAFRLLPPAPQALARAYTPDGELLAIVRYDERAGVWRPAKVFA